MASPILANIYLHELDEKVQEIQARENRGEGQKQRNPLYVRLQSQKQRLVKKGATRTKTFRALVKQIRSIPSGVVNDPHFIRIKYIRYADDWIIGIAGPNTLGPSENNLKRKGKICYTFGMETLSKEQKYAQMRESLNEKQWRQYVAMEAEERGNIAEVAREAKVSENTVRSGMREIAAGDVYQEGERVRKKGGGRKPLVERDSTLLEDLDAILQTSRRSDEQCAVDEQIVVTSGERTGGSWTQHQKVSFGGTAT